MEWNDRGKKISEILKLKTPPVGVKFLEDEKIPEDAFRPSKYDLKMAVCQAIAFARYSGRTVALKGEDFACPPVTLIYGVATYDSLKEILVSVNWLKDMSCDFEEVKLPAGKYKVFLFGDLTKMKEKPDAILIFGNPEQIGRLIQAKTYFGGTVKASLTAKMASCAEALLPALLDKEVAIAVPGAGDRVFAAIDENELVFAMPYEWLDKIIEGLENAGKGANVSYPVQRYLFFTPRFPRTYREFAEKFKKV
ncbi:MAG: DUF169 domain-containing protein [Archaeoglobaceae archaeon]|nr:DUF169 domain-containing protein [Archaeoglobaceae archaeon]MCX8152727.1 DUF169 domain-containing protein [Archaeoglobaceae archaeon]MDW8013434.1 DUF169 domain-containing protein [Archaeoglobaceae archaeon]